MNRGLLYGPGLPAAGRVATVAPHPASLAVASDGDERRVPYGDLAARAAGWNADALLLEWHDAGGTWSLLVDGPSLKALRAAAPEALRTRLGRLAETRRTPAALPMLAMLGLLLAVLLAVIVLLYGQADRLVDLAVRRIPVEWEERLGALTAEVLTRAAPAQPDGPASQAVAAIGARLVAHVEAPYSFRFVLLDDPQVNALAAPGGWVIVYTGLVRRARSADELAGVLAHEVEHVLLRHSLRGLVRQLGWSTVLGVLLWGAGDLGTPLATWASQLEGLRFSRQQESDADAAAVRLLERAAIDPHGLANFFEQLAEHDAGAPDFLSTHPASDDRARRIREAIGDTPAAAALPIDWKAVQEDASEP